MASAYETAFVDWLACAVAGRDEPAAQAARALRDPVAAAAAAGHVLDFDDTYLPGLSHLSAPTAPAALVLGAEIGTTVGEVLDAYAAGFEAMAAVAAANHPALYERGWHPTAICGSAGAAVAAARLLDLDAERTRVAARLALLRAGGLRAAFGSDGKSLQVGAAASAGVAGARLAAGGATAGIGIAQGFEQAYGGRWVEPGAGGGDAVAENWIKAYPCCLQTHSAIEAAAAIDAEGEMVVTVHPLSLLAASVGDPATGLEAKFSIPYLVAYTLLHGPPRVDSFRGADAAARALAAERVIVRSDPSLLESEAIVEAAGGNQVARVVAALGSPANPMTGAALAAKVRSLAGESLTGALDDRDRPARELLAATGLGTP